MAQPEGMVEVGYFSIRGPGLQCCGHCLHSIFRFTGMNPLCPNPFGLIPSFTGVFRGKLLDKLLDCEIFMTLEQVETLVENCRKHNSLRKPHRFRNGSLRR